MMENSKSKGIKFLLGMISKLQRSAIFRSIFMALLPADSIASPNSTIPVPNVQVWEPMVDLFLFKPPQHP